MKNLPAFLLLLLAKTAFMALKPLDKTLLDQVIQLENKAYALTQKAKNVQWLRNYRNVGEDTHIYFDNSALPFNYSRPNIIMPAIKKASDIAQKIAGEVGEYAVWAGALPLSNTDISYVITAFYIKNQANQDESEFVRQAIDLVTQFLLLKATYKLLDKARAQTKPVEAEQFIQKAQSLLDYAETL